MREALGVSGKFGRPNLNAFFILGLSGGSRQEELVKVMSVQNQFEALDKNFQFFFFYFY